MQWHARCVAARLLFEESRDETALPSKIRNRDSNREPTRLTYPSQAVCSPADVHATRVNLCRDKLGSATTLRRKPYNSLVNATIHALHFAFFYVWLVISSKCLETPSLRWSLECARAFPEDLSDDLFLPGRRRELGHLIHRISRKTYDCSLKSLTVLGVPRPPSDLRILESLSFSRPLTFVHVLSY